ncbi:SDR family oxidoreductase [Vitiosangium sp. GDMCC 1.1324]|uniref:SDR family oxidoreductase n=1 Tax=Vitiosangium sp. (strain GDMCC 1.1324) TaxID=2138576 RepID=UPI000D3D40A3|nr:SDR family oxidoreductase [Vitiosangium sp. GDMCC 1.1324]PTL84443.1 short-chain dehydrogenase [Vitiosangium sp. GDMCC 1.1324]
MDLGLKGRRALVLGASSGLGYASAAQLVKEGARVAICSRDEGRIRDAARKMGAELAVTADLTKSGTTKELVEKVIEAMGGVDILVMNTGGPPKGSIEKITAEQWQEGFQSLWMSVVEGLQAALPGMKDRRWGRIILVTSVAAREAMSLLTVSNGLRAGLMGLVKTVSNEVAEHGVTINGVQPGYHATERLAELGVPEDKITSAIPARRLGKPEELGALVAFLSSQQAGYITGQSLVIDGGWMRGF